MDGADFSHVVSFDYYYKSASSSEKGQERNFYVKYRIEGGDWNTVYTMYQNDEALVQVLTPKRISVTLPEDVAGKKVQISLGIRNNVNNTDMFAMLIGNVSFGSWCEDAYATISLNAALPSEDGKMKASFINAGLKELNSCKYKVRLNGKSVVDGDLEFPSALASGAAFDTEISLNMSDMVEGKNILQIWVGEVNGKSVDNFDTIEYGFANVKASQVDKYRPVIEFFTSSTCPYCAGVSKSYQLYLDDLCTKRGLLSVIKYQCSGPGSGDPYWISGNDNRQGYYLSLVDGFSSGIPSSVYSGQTDTKTWGATVAAVGQLRSKVLEESKQQSLISIRFDTLSLDEETGLLEFTVRLVPIVDMNANLIPVVVEGTTTGNVMTNGETEFHWVTMAYPAGAFGEEVGILAGEEKTFTYTVDLSKTHTEEYTDIEVVCLFQDYNTGKLYQSAVYDYDNPPSYDEDDDEDDEPGVANEDAASASSNVVIYPNPARDQIIIAGAEGFTASIFDMKGRVVRKIVSVSEESVIDLNGLVQGTYIVRIVNGNSIINKKLSVIR